MDREKFKKMNDKERIAWVESKYTEGYTTSQIVKEFDIPKNTLGDTFRRNGYASSKSKKMYVKAEYVNNSSEDVMIKPSAEPGHKVVKHKNNSTKLIVKEYENNTNISHLPINIENELIKMISWYKKQQKIEQEREEIYNWVLKQMQLQKTIIDVPKLEIRKDKLTGKIRSRSFTIYQDVLEKFNNFCKDKPYSKQDLLSMALLEYMEKYK